MRKRDTWTDSCGLIRCVACGSTNTELCDSRRKSGTYNRQTRCIDCGDLRTVKLPRPTDAELYDARRRSDAYSLRNPTKLASVRAWWEANTHKGYTSASGARACSIELEMPYFIVCGLQRDAFSGDAAPPWRAAQAPAVDRAMLADDDDDEEGGELFGVVCEGCTLAYATRALPRPLCEDCAEDGEQAELEMPRDRVADAAAGRAAARQPRPPKRTRRYIIDDDGLFQPVREGEPLHVCPTCKATAHTHFELISSWGIRTNKRTGARSPQSLCTPCRTAHGRQRRKMQLTLVSDSSEQAAPPCAMKQGELDEIARRAVAALRNGEATVELVVQDDPKVTRALDADTMAAGRYPICADGPLGQILDINKVGNKASLRLCLNAIELRDWAVAQGAKILTAPPVISESAMSAYQNPPGLAELVGGRR